MTSHDRRQQTKAATSPARSLTAIGAVLPAVCVFGSRRLGTRPKSPADERAWRRDGSPATWNRSADGMTVVLSTRPDKGRAGAAKGRSDAFHVAGQQLSYEELQRLPADPAGLRGWIEKAVRVRKA
ncbi:hypothetical protein ACIBCT_30905 [Streptosporangium sp. NPDC050855]|uniref:hypothetical protein n=1 Tax=Streptosporangium sp. NPDC050855 TaxID=3366194 RepID=UPI0037899B36